MVENNSARVVRRITMTNRLCWKGGTPNLISSLAEVALSKALRKNKNAHMGSKSESALISTEILIMDKKPLDAVAFNCEVSVQNLIDGCDVILLLIPQLAKLCEEMDATPPHKFISDTRENLISMKEEMPLVLKEADDQGGLLFDSLHGFYISAGLNVDGKRFKSFRLEANVYHVNGLL
ncbi:hypothetical protein L1987_61293 [Smallanthus sonchifolius]|uniref:Uncharacterized protein n=1 Tax=Smallanthus sonchifolius TaxID=185202 RepID=A0ACB9DB17_9ASTR|nr:hypothetical protein L1987_61293 [Smallanthus sonchifolius]